MGNCGEGGRGYGKYTCWKPIRKTCYRPKEANFNLPLVYGESGERATCC